MVWYSKGVKGYKLWYHEANVKLLIVSIEVVFMKDGTPFYILEMVCWQKHGC